MGFSAVLPVSSVLNAANVSLGCVEQFGDIASGSSCCQRRSDSDNVHVGKFGLWVTFSNSMSAALHRVANILFRGAGSQMRWINASGVVA